MNVLIIESNDEDAEAVRAELELLGIGVRVVADGEEGIARATEKRPDLILLTIELPRMNGFSVCNKLKRTPETKPVPLALLSSEATEETFEQHKRLRTRADYYIHKPTTSGEILARVFELPAVRDVFQSLSGGKANDVPPEILQQGAAATRSYLDKLAEQGTHVREAKLLVLGAGGVGKTSLCKRLIHNDFDAAETTTQGIALREQMQIQHWGIAPAASESNETLVKVWDFGGQEIYHSTHRFFLSTRALYLIVWDGRQESSTQQLEYWLRTVEGYAADAPVLLVQNKCDERVQDINLRDLRESFPQIVGYFQVSCSRPDFAPHSLAELSRAIATQIEALEHVGMWWPRAWLEVRQKLESMARPLLSWRDFQQLSSAAQVDAEETLQLCGLLHDLGVVLNFRSDPLLRKVLILNPSWGTDAVYRVLDDERVKRRRGILTEEDADEAWGALAPPEHHPLLMRLIANFGLMFRIAHSNDYLVPELLPEQRHESAVVGSGEVTTFEYDLGYLPSGLLPAFLVRVHASIRRTDEGQYICWRSGAILEGFESGALVVAHPTERRITAQVWGKMKMELLGVIRREMDDVLRSYSRLHVLRKVRCNCASDCSHRWSYDYLRRAYQNSVPSVQCERTLRFVRVSALLGTVEPLDQWQHSAATRLVMGNQTTNITINGGNVGAIAVGQGAQATGHVESRTGAENLLEEIKAAQLALVADQEQLSDGVYEALNQFLRMCREIQVQGEQRQTVDEGVRQLLEDCWVQHTAKDLRPGVLPEGSKIVQALLASPVLAAAVKLLG